MSRKPYRVAAAGLILLASLIVTPLHSRPHKIPQYVPADISSASDIAYPVDTLAAGAVTLLLNLDNTAHIQNVMVLRDFQPLTRSVQNAVQNWTFTPASR